MSLLSFLLVCCERAASLDAPRSVGDAACAFFRSETRQLVIYDFYLTKMGERAQCVRYKSTWKTQPPRRDPPPADHVQTTVRLVLFRSLV